MTTPKIVFVDTETTSLRPDRRAWDIALIVREPGKPDAEHQWFVYPDQLDLGNADPKSLQVGRFYERHPEFQADVHPGDVDDVSELVVMHEVEHLTRGAHLVGAVPSFDAEVLANRMRANDPRPAVRRPGGYGPAGGWQPMSRVTAFLRRRWAGADERATTIPELAEVQQQVQRLTEELEIERINVGEYHDAARRTSDAQAAELARLRRDLHAERQQRRQERAEVVDARTRVLRLGADLAAARARLERLPTDLDWAAVRADRADLRHQLSLRQADLEQLHKQLLDARHRGTVTVLPEKAPDPDAVLQAQVAAAYAFADELAGYCSPHGVSARYADRLRQLLDQAAPQTAGVP